MTGGGTAVFAASEAYVGTWHLDSKPAGNPHHFADAGGSGTRAYALGALETVDSVAAGDSGVGVHPAHGVLGAGVHLNGTDAYISVSDTLSSPPGFTLSFWFRTTTREGGKLAGYVLPGISGDYNFDRVLWMDNNGILRFGFTMGVLGNPGAVGAWQPFESAKAYNDGQWHHVSYSMGEAVFHLYVDGEKAIGYAGPIRSLSRTGFWRFGYVGEGKWEPAWTSEYFRGSLDEIRLLHAPRNGEWLRLDQLAQQPGSKLLELERH